MKKAVVLFVMALAAGSALLPSAGGHPPSNPFDTTIFAPIQPGGFQVKLETVATGLTAPNKGVVDWLLACPAKDFFVPIQSESTDTL